MTLLQYVKHTRGRVTHLAKVLGVRASLVSMWATGARQVPADRCMAIERATKGRVTVRTLRPDLSWRHYRRVA